MEFSGNFLDICSKKIVDKRSVETVTMTQRGRSNTLIASGSLEEDLAGLNLVIITTKPLSYS